MRKGNKLPQLSIAGWILAIICSGPAGALTIAIDDTTDNVMINSDSKNTMVVGNQASEIFQITDPLLNTPGTGIVAAFVEPPGGLTGLQTASDLIGVDQNSFALDFNSDVDGGSSTQVNCSLTGIFDCMTETASSVDVGPILYGASSGITINVTSDLDSLPVPEPSSMIIFGSCLACMVGLKWRRTRRLIADPALGPKSDVPALSANSQVHYQPGASGNFGLGGAHFGGSTADHADLAAAGSPTNDQVVWIPTSRNVMSPTVLSGPCKSCCYGAGQISLGDPGGHDRRMARKCWTNGTRT
jgi:hypothetical protein